MSRLDDRVVAAFRDLAGDGSGPSLDLDVLRTGRRRRRLVQAVVVGTAAAVVLVLALAGTQSKQASPGPAGTPSPTAAPTTTPTGTRPAPSDGPAGGPVLEPLPGAPGHLGWANSVAGLAVGPTGTIYVWDFDAGAGRYRTRAVSATGQVLSSASSGGWGADPAPAAIDGAGNLYIAGGTRILKMGPDGRLSTLAGSTTPGTADGTGDSARFPSMAGLAVAPTGDLYVTEGTVVRRVSPQGHVHTLSLCVNPQATASMPPNCLGGPFPIAVSPDGTIFLGSDDYRIRSVTTDGRVTQLAAGDMGGDGLFHRMPSIAFDPLDSSLVVHDEVGWHTVSGNGTIRPAPDSLVGLTSIAVGKDGTVYSIDRGAVVQLKPSS